MRKSASLKARARELRQNMTPAEKILWTELRNRRFADFKFRRQQPIGPYIADFFCAAAKVVLELDGQTHLGREAPDARRQAWLEGQGFLVLRFWNNLVYDDKETVLEAVWRACKSRQGLARSAPSPPAPLQQGERGEEGSRSSPPGGAA